MIAMALNFAQVFLIWSKVFKMHKRNLVAKLLHAKLENFINHFLLCGDDDRRRQGSRESNLFAENLSFKILFMPKFQHSPAAKFVRAQCDIKQNY